jgi:hypothetical protein
VPGAAAGAASPGRSRLAPLSPSSSKRSAIGYQNSQLLLRMNSVHSVRWIAQDMMAGSSPARLTDCRV